MNLNLKNKIVLVTGASKGIGAAIAETFAAEGAYLILVARSKEELEKLQLHLKNTYNVNCQYFAIDLSSSQDLQSLANQIEKIDILVNNAGAIPGGNLFDIDIEKWKKSWDLKVWGYITLTKLFYAKMKQTKHGVIVNIIGIAGERYNSDYIAGTSANASLIAFTKSLGSISLDDGIRVLGVNPGTTATDRIKNLKAYADLDKSENKSMRLGTVNEIADVVVFLSSERASYISGTVVNIDGGMASRN